MVTRVPPRRWASRKATRCRRSSKPPRSWSPRGKGLRQVGTFDRKWNRGFSRFDPERIQQAHRLEPGLRFSPSGGAGSCPVIRRAPRLRGSSSRRPLHQDQQPVVELHDVEQMHEQPGQPGCSRPGAADQATAAADGRHAALVAVVKCRDGPAREPLPMLKYTLCCTATGATPAAACHPGCARWARSPMTKPRRNSTVRSGLTMTRPMRSVSQPACAQRGPVQMPARPRSTVPCAPA